jgi:hypothetical protein
MHKRKKKTKTKGGHDRNSVAILKNYRKELSRNGIKSKLRLVSERYDFDHLHVESVKIKTSIDVTPADNDQIQLAIPYRRYQAAPDAAIQIIIDLAKKGTA